MRVCESARERVCDCARGRRRGCGRGCMIARVRMGGFWCGSARACGCGSTLTLLLSGALLAFCCSCVGRSAFGLRLVALASRSSKKCNTNNQTSSESRVNDKTNRRGKCGKQQLAATAAKTTADHCASAKQQEMQHRQPNEQQEQHERQNTSKTTTGSNGSNTNTKKTTPTNNTSKNSCDNGKNNIKHYATCACHAHALALAQGGPQIARVAGRRRPLEEGCFATLPRSVLMIHRTRSLDVHRPGARQ